MNRCIVVHGWEGYPEAGWFPWLARELTARGHFSGPADNCAELPEALAAVLTVSGTR